MKSTYNILAILFLSLFIISCNHKQTIEQKTTRYCLSDTMKRMVTIDSVTMCNLTDELNLSGEVSFNENKVVKIFPRSSGQVLKCSVSFGDKVNKGQVLAVIRSADVAGSYSDLSSADADIAIAKRQMESAESLYKSGIGSEKDYVDAKQVYQKALAAKTRIRSMLAINGGANTSPRGTYVLTSPIDGFIVEKKINAGSFIRQDMSDNLFTISDMKDVWVMANVYEADIRKVKEGSPVTVTTLAYPDKTFTGRIDRVSDVLDPNNKTLKVRVRLDNAGLLLKPEMFTKVVVTNVEENKAICIPSSSVVEESGKTYVVVYKNDCNLYVQPIDVMKQVGDKTFLNAGVQPGEKLIGKNALLLYNQFTENE